MIYRYRYVERFCVG